MTAIGPGTRLLCIVDHEDSALKVGTIYTCREVLPTNEKPTHCPQHGWNSGCFGILLEEVADPIQSMLFETVAYASCCFTPPGQGSARGADAPAGRAHGPRRRSRRHHSCQATGDRLTMADTHIVVAGQSNVLGYLNTGPAPYQPTTRVQIWADTDGDGVPDAWNYMLPGSNTGTKANPTCWGPEVQFANRWLSANPTGNLWIVKNGCVKGSTSLAQDDTVGVADWSPESTGELFATAATTARGAHANLVGGPYAFDSYDAMLWMQGEQDATNETWANNYDVNLRDFLQHVRDPVVGWLVNRVLIGRISDSAALTYNQTVRIAQWDVSNSDLINQPGFSTIGFPRQPDNIHYTADGHVLLGNAFYNVFVGP